MSPPYKARKNIIVRPNNMPKFCRAKVLRFLRTEFWPIFTDISEASSSCKERMIKTVQYELNCDKKFAIFTLQYNLSGQTWEGFFVCHVTCLSIMKRSRWPVSSTLQLCLKGLTTCNIETTWPRQIICRPACIKWGHLRNNDYACGCYACRKLCNTQKPDNSSRKAIRFCTSWILLPCKNNCVITCVITFWMSDKSVIPKITLLHTFNHTSHVWFTQIQEVC